MPIKEITRSSENNETSVLYTYDTLQRPKTKKVYDSSGNLVYQEEYSYEVTSDYRKETKTVVGDENTPSVITSVYYDKSGNKIKSETGNDVETYTADYAGNITSIKSARANSEGWNEVHQSQYDFMGNVVKETDELGNSVRAEYDSLGRKVKEYDQNGYATEYKYDNLGRVIEQKSPVEESGGTVYYAIKKMWYDKNGNLIKERVNTNASGEAETYNEVEYTYDNRNRLTKTKAYDGEKYSYVQNCYDVKGNLLRVYTGLSSPLTINGLDDVTVSADNEYAVTKYSYDALSRLLETTDALGKSESNIYDKATGLMLSSTDRNGQSFSYNYDGMGNLTLKSIADGTNSETTVYGAIGQPVSKQNAVTTVNYTYNDKGLLTSESDTAAGTIKSYTYDSNGNRLTFTLTRNGQVEINQSYSYDKLNRLISVSENGEVIAQYSYDDKGNRTQTVISDGYTTNYAYNVAGLLTSQTTGNKLSETYTYYLNGNQKSKTSNGQTTNYAYDSMNRLVSENDTHYTFDDFGNRSTMTSGDVTTTYSYDLNNRLTESKAVNGTVTTTDKYFYDYNGNQVTRATTVNQPNSDGVTGDYSLSDKTDNNVALYEYDCYNRMVGVDTNGIVSSYKYSPDGMRYSKTVDGNTIVFVYDNANVIEEITTDSANKYYRGIEIIKNDDNLYYLYNGQGDVSILADNTGSVVASYTFDAYGNQSQENTVYNPFGYRGEYTDSESGLVYLRARMYDSETGRFVNEDPARDNYNWYVYCSNNPIVFVDPFGLFDYNTKLSYNQTYNQDVEVLQNELAWLGYLDMSGGGWGYFGTKTQAAVNAYKNDKGLWNFGQYKGVVGVTTWESLGLIYRTQADINAGIEIVMYNGRKQYKDVSKPINNALLNAKGTFQEHKYNFKWFYDQVKTGAPWDIKLKNNWNKTIAPGTYPGSYSTKVMLYGELTTPEALGNITYGYLGSAAGFSESILLQGGDAAANGVSLSPKGIYNGVTGIIKSADSQEDKNNIKKGVNWYNR